MRTWCSLRVVLNGKNRMIQTGHPLNRMVVQADMCQRQFAKASLDYGRGRRHIKECYRTLHGKIMVLRRNFDLSCPKVHDGMIGPMVTELQFIGLQAEGQTQNLMTQTNAKNRIASDQLLHGVHSIRKAFGIARTVREEYAVRFKGRDVIR